MRDHLLLLTGVLLALCAAWSAMSEVFLTWANFLNILTASSTVGVLAIGAAFVIGSGGIDLSVGSLLALSITVSALVAGHSDSPSLLIAAICLLTGGAAGALNGLLVGAAKLPAFIVTLGMLSFARGLALIVSDGRPVYGLPEGILSMGQGEFAGIPAPVLLFLLTALVAHIVLGHTAFGRHALAVGDNQRAAQNAGIRINRLKLMLYAFSGVLAALSGILTMGRVNAADPTAGMMYELTAITAAVIGGATLRGGRASVIGAVLGALTMGVLQNGLTLVDVAPYYHQVAIGVVLILAVSVSQSRERRHAMH